VPDALFAAHPNLLVVGPVARARQILPWQFFREPITRCCADATPLALPATGGGTFVLLRVDILSTPGQLALLQWIEREGAHTQIVSLAERNLFPLVESGAFRDDLYYRLNTVYLEARRSIETAARASLRG
jgi:Sigma-54 interaction domain